MTSIRLKRINVCLICNQEFHPYSKDQKYCSRKCFDTVRSQHRNTRVQKICETCGDEYTVQAYRADQSRFCSMQCYVREQPSRTFVCPKCQNEFVSRDQDAIYCSRKCKGLASRERKGKNAPAYIDGRSLRNQRGIDQPKLKLWRKAVYERDNHTCQHCGKTQVAIHAHHIKSYSKHPEFRFDVSNGITLCVPCHEAVHGRKLSSPSPFPKHCVDCGKKTKGRGMRCHSCGSKHGYTKRSKN